MIGTTIEVGRSILSHLENRVLFTKFLPFSRKLKAYFSTARHNEVSGKVVQSYS
jgi:hypothetical protein